MNASEMPGTSTGPSEAGDALQSNAYPPLVRALAVLIVGGLAAFAVWSVPALQDATWDFTSLSTYALAAIIITWVGWWMLFSRTHYTDGVLAQTWLWDKRVTASEVATFKIVHWPWLQGVVSPRMLIRRRNGSMTWIHAADPSLLVAFGHSVVRHQSGVPTAGSASGS